MRIITLKTRPTKKGFTLRATIDRIPRDHALPVTTAVHAALRRIIDEHQK